VQEAAGKRTADPVNRENLRPFKKAAGSCVSGTYAGEDRIFQRRGFQKNDKGRNDKTEILRTIAECDTTSHERSELQAASR
jgi:hypothetical protein